MERNSIPGNGARSGLAGEPVKPDQAQPNKTKQKSLVCWVLFVRIGTFQWVAVKKNKKILPAVLSPPDLSKDAGCPGLRAPVLTRRFALNSGARLQ